MNPKQFKTNRKALKLTQTQLAEELGCKGGYRVISSIETGRRQPSDILLRAFNLLKYLHNLRKTLEKHIKEIEQDMIDESHDESGQSFARGQIDSLRFILKMMRLSKILTINKK